MELEMLTLAERIVKAQEEYKTIGAFYTQRGIYVNAPMKAAIKERLAESFNVPQEAI